VKYLWFSGAVALLAVVGAVLVVVWPASTGPATAAGPGPLGSGGEASGECAPVSSVGVPTTMAIVVLPNAGKTTVTVEGVTLSHPRGLKLLHAFVAPIIGNDLIGVVPYPPRSSPAWPLRKPAVGAQVKAGATDNLVLAVAATRRPSGASGGAVVRYVAGGSSYVLRSRIGYQIKVSPAHC
jgi:hypothetical protein